MLRALLVPRLLLRSRVGATRWCASAETATINRLLDKAYHDRAELLSQLKVQTSLQEQRDKKLKETLEKGHGDRAELQEQLAALTHNFNQLADKWKADSIGMRERVTRKGIEGKGGQSRMAYRPAMEYAEKQPTHVGELNHEYLAKLAVNGNHCARRERLIREVVCVDNVTWSQAHEAINKFDEYNERYYWFETLPHRVGIIAACVCGVGSILLVFHPTIAQWYGVNIAGEDLPDEVKDISELTINQVGAWTWSWMEPVLGVASFALLCFQFTRSQANRMNMRTYSQQLVTWRARRILDKFGHVYDGSMLVAWSKFLPKVGLHWFPTYERNFRLKGPRSGL